MLCFCLWLNNVLSYEYTPFYLSIYHLGRYLSCFNLVAFINNVAVNIHGQFLCRCKFSVLMVTCLGVDLLCLMAALCLAFWGTARLFLLELHCLPFPAAVWVGSDSSTSSSAHAVVGLINYYGHLTVFGFAFSWWPMISSIFSCAYWIFVYLRWKMSYLVPLPIFKIEFVYILLV